MFHRWRPSTPPPFDAERRAVPLSGALALESRARHPALWIPRAVGRVVDAAGCRPAGPARGRVGPGGGPPRQWLLGHGGSQRTIGRPVAGTDPDGRSVDGP